MHFKTQYNVIRDCIHLFTPTFASSAFLRDPYNQKTTLFITFVLQRQCVYNIYRYKASAKKQAYLKRIWIARIFSTLSVVSS